MCQTSIHHCLLFQTKNLTSQNIYLSNIYIYYILNATVYDNTESFYCILLYFIVQCILLLEQPDDKAQVKGAHSYEFIVRSPIMIPIQHFRQWTVPHHSARTVTAGLVINVASSYTYLLVDRSMTIKNMGMGSLNIIHSNRHMTFVNQSMTKVWMNQLPMISVVNYSKERPWTTMTWALVAQLATTPT